MVSEGGGGPLSTALSQPAPHLLGVGEEQDLGDGRGVDDGVECWQLCA